MKIQSIANTNFKGLFIDKKSQNNNNWRMEYSPYSWENNNTSKHAIKEKIDVLASKLPDNEEIFETEGTFRDMYHNYNLTPKIERSRDILGTVSYFKDNETDDKFAHIDYVEPMNREESLQIYEKKLEKFQEMKKLKEIELRESIVNSKAEIEELSNELDEASKDYDYAFFQKQKNREKNKLENTGKKLIEKFDLLQKISEDYIKLRDSIEIVNETRKNILKELSQIADAKKVNKYIDISKRNIYDPNRLLWEALQNVQSACEKFVSLPHKTIPVAELIKQTKESITSPELSAKVIKLVDELIKKFI